MSKTRPPYTPEFRRQMIELVRAGYRACQSQEQSWREKRRVRELEEMRAKSGGVHLGAVPGMPAGDRDVARSPEARLQRAREMLEDGLLTDAEYEQVKARILGEL